MLEQVKASAGSGKTYALTRRFVRLLFGSAEGPLPAACGQAGREYGWPEIMAVTFTNKAAAEMKERVVAALKLRALGRDDTPCGDEPPERAALWLARILRHYQQLNIRTIDSLLAVLMRIFALEAGLPPDFTPVFDSRELFDPSLEALTERAEAGDGPERDLLAGALRAMLALEQKPGFMPTEAFRDRLARMADVRLTDQARYEDDPQVLHDAIEPLRADFVGAARALAGTLDGLDPLANFLKFLDKCLGHDAGAPVPDSAYAHKDSFTECVKKASQGAVTTPHELAFAGLRDAHAAYRDGRALLEAARNWCGFINLADAVAEEMRAQMAGRGMLVNSLCAGLAREMLEDGLGVPDAFCRMGARLRHMLVDEFQDTSRDQWGAMSPLAGECLAQGGGLYIVGDVKQAIYGWRGGDARLFDEVPDDPSLAAMAEVRRETLPMNWRSARRVVECNNDVFGPLGDADRALAVARAMRPEAQGEAQGDLAGAIRHAFEGARQELPPHKRGDAGYVRMTRLRADSKDALYAAVHDALRDTVMDAVGRRRPGDVAVLVRTNTEAAQVADWLIGWGLPVVTKNSLRLEGHPVVRQLVSLLAFLDYPLDDLALWGFVSGAEVFGGAAGLGGRELADWLAAQPRGPLYPVLLRDFPGLCERRLSRYVRRAGFMTPYDVVCEALDDFKVLERNPGAAPFVRRFMEVVHAAERDGRQSIASFLDYWEAGGAEEKVPLPENVPAVRVLTIHDAKGLEFPVVVVPFHHWETRPDGAPIPFGYRGMRLLAPPRKEMGPVWDEHMNAKMVEQLALLYVAWTRPREELHCLLTSTPVYDRYPFVHALDALLAGRGFEGDEDGPQVWEYGARPAAAASGDAADAASAEATAEATGGGAEDAAAPGGAACAASDAGEADALPDDPMAWLPRLKIHRHFSDDAAPGDLLTGAPVFDARARGTLVHDALDRLGGPHGADTARAARAAVSAHADVLPPGGAAREALAAEVAAILDWALSLPEFRSWVERGIPECPILDAEGNEHRPDLLVPGEDETVVVEYKTGAPDPAHQDQVRRYMGLLAAMADAPARLRAVIIYLDRRETMEVLP